MKSYDLNLNKEIIHIEHTNFKNKEWWWYAQLDLLYHYMRENSWSLGISVFMIESKADMSWDDFVVQF
jgi:hypothetical protein